MKSLILTTYPSTGGAAIAASRLVCALQKSGVEVSVLARRNIAWGPAALRKQSWGSIWERMMIWRRNGFSKEALWAMDIACCGQDVTQTREFREADVIHLHWVNQSFLSLRTLEKIVCSGKRVVWTMHDAWCSTGICHLTLGCENYRGECGNCKYLKRPGDDDLSHEVWLRKQRLYSKGDIRFVTCSQWLRGETQKSRLLGDKSVVAIPNPIDTEFYGPMDREQVRKELGLPLDKPLILFVALNVHDPYKGMPYLLDAVRKLNTKDAAVVMLGNSNAAVREALGGIPSYAMGYVRDAQVIRKVYSAVDAFVLPSLSENLPNTIMEAMSCGTPCVGFRVGGIPEMIDHQENGYVAAYKDAADLARGIDYVLARPQLGVNARAKVLREYSEASVAERYLAVYEASKS